MAPVNVLVLFLCVSSALLRASRGHPQCLNFQPPFADEGMSYCAEYKDFGCCTRRGDRLANTATTIALNKLTSSQDKQVCEDFLKNISCLTCSPYAAHIFDTEGRNMKREFPQLCRSHCVEVYTKCHLSLFRMFKLHPWRDGLVSKRPRDEEELASDARAFCEHYIPEDSAYCYPQVLNGPDIDGFSTEQVGELGCLCGQPVASGLRNPLAAVHAGDGSGRLFIVEQIGVVRVLDRARNLLPQPFLNITDRVLPISRTGDERGLLGLAFHPDYSSNGLFYVYYSTLISTRHHSRVSEFHVDASDPNQAVADSERVLFTVQQPFGNHNGGQLLFSDGYLLVFLGDGGAAGDPLGNGQNL